MIQAKQVIPKFFLDEYNLDPSKTKYVAVEPYCSDDHIYFYDETLVLSPKIYHKVLLKYQVFKKFDEDLNEILT